MDDMISRAKLVQKIKEAQDSLMSNDDKTWEMNKNYFKGLSWAHRLTLDAQPEDAEPVRHGRWICAPGEMVALVCSECGQVMPFVPEYLPGTPPYCNCGAKMDGDDTDVRPPENDG